MGQLPQQCRSVKQGRAGTGRGDECAGGRRCAGQSRARGVGLVFLAALMLSCGGEAIDTTGKTIDVVNYFPLELGRRWIYFDPEGRFLTLAFTDTTTVVGFDALVLTYTFTRDPDAEVAPSFEAYFGLDPDQGVMFYGYKDYELGESASYSPGVPFAGNEMVIGESITTSTAESGQLVKYVTTLVAHGIVETYFGTFPDAVDVTMGPENGEQPKHFLARDIGMVKFDWKGVRYQLYDYDASGGSGE